MSGSLAAPSDPPLALEGNGPGGSLLNCHVPPERDRVAPDQLATRGVAARRLGAVPMEAILGQRATGAPQWVTVSMFALLALAAIEFAVKVTTLRRNSSALLLDGARAWTSRKLSSEQ